MLHCTLLDLRTKEIINLNSGHRLGYVCDVMFSLSEGQMTALIVPGPSRFFGLFGREEDLIVPWDKITKIGEDIILVDMEVEPRRQRERGGRGRWLS